VGGGITGLSAAYFLKESGRSVCVLERDRLVSGDTACTTAHLTSIPDVRLADLAKHFGEPAAALVWHGGDAAISAIEHTVNELQIDCDFSRVPAFVHAPLGNSNGKDSTADDAREEGKQLRAEATLARQLDTAAVLSDSVPVVNRPGIAFPNQGKFHPLAYLAAVAQAIPGGGCDVFEHSEVTEVEDEPLAVKCGTHRVICDYVVIATHVPLMGKTGLVRATLLQTKLAPYTSYAVRAKIPQGTLPAALFYDTSDPYYYLRIDRGESSDYAIFGGEDHKTGQVTKTQKCFERLEEVLHGVLPRAKVDRRWSGQVVETNDGLPLIGEIAEGQFIATGFAGNGMTFGTLAALMACDAVLGRDNPWQELFSPDRKKLRGGTLRYLQENADFPYYFLRDRLAPSETSTRAVHRGEGKILKLDGDRVACSRGDDGKLTMVSAVCTHMGCLVRWNQVEQTWDCPCHGSRFSPEGELIAGPAETPLEKAAKSKRAQQKAKAKFS
jgi:glycine/D-amino acid oxidase-like deaminating enzyme/nitrite reductase/ring-hydroxylating ferredoxin subunit